MRLILSLIAILLVACSGSPAEPTAMADDGLADDGLADDGLADDGLADDGMGVEDAGNEMAGDGMGVEDAGNEMAGDAADEMANEAADDLKEKLSGYLGMTPTYKVTYRITAMGQTSTVTQYFDEGKFRMDATAEGVESRTYMLDTMVSCMNQGGWMCFELDGRISPEGSIDDTTEYEITSLPTRTVTGVVAECFELVDDQGMVEYCVSPEGVPLYVETIAGDVSSVLEATAYSTTVPSGTWELPAEPGTFEMPSMP